MKNIKSVDYHQLLWKQKNWGGRYFELLSGDDQVGVLYWPKWLSYMAIAEGGDGRWAIDRPGFFADKVVVTDLKSGEEAAQFFYGWLGDGVITLSNGRSYEWYRTGFLSNNWTIEDEVGDVLLEIKEWMHWFKHRADIVLRVGTIMRSELPLLIFLGWYLAYMQMQDAAAAVAATSAAV